MTIKSHSEKTPLQQTPETPIPSAKDQILAGTRRKIGGLIEVVTLTGALTL